jgi:hypothetical protein
MKARKFRFRAFFFGRELQSRVETKGIRPEDGRYNVG